LKLLFNILLFLAAFTGMAQESPYSVPIDTTNISKQYIPTGVRFGLDLLGPALYLVDNRTLSYELTAETDISNFGIMLEAGHQEFAETNENVEYLMKGNFLRVGPEVNFLASDKQLNSFSLGLRYAWSSFSETVVGDVVEDNWGAVPVSFDIQTNYSEWVEMTTGVRVRLWKGLFTGYILRFRFLHRATFPGVPFEPYYVPGYGLAARPSTWGFRYYVLYRLQWAKKPIKIKNKN
jgi:hypothetical protein